MARIGQSKVGHLEDHVAEQSGPGITNTAESKVAVDLGTDAGITVLVII